MSLDKQILACQGRGGCHNTLPCHVGMQKPMDTASYPTKAESSTTPIRKVLQQHFFNSKAETLAVAIDLGTC
jgi:ferredoxin